MIRNNEFIRAGARLLTLLSLIIAPQLVHANDGRVLFVFGGASIERGDTAVAAQRGARIQAGDTLVTSLAGRMHVRMNDGSLISLKPDTRFVIEAYEAPEPVRPQPSAQDAPSETPSAPLVAASDVSGGRAIFGLLRGGFRTLTGLIGKSERSEYSVRTPVATIGIRGTDYSVFHCVANCANPGATTFGVWDGGITVSNNSETRDIDAGQFGIVRDISAPIESVDAPPPGVESDTPPPPPRDGGDDDGGDAPPERSEPRPRPTPAGDGGGSSFEGGSDSGAGGGDDGGEAIPPDGRPVEPDLVDRQFRNVAVSTSALPGIGGFVSGGNSSVFAFDSANALIQTAASHPDGTGVYGIGDATHLDGGFDPQTGIRWGRWSDGTGTLSVSGGPSGPLALTPDSFHYIIGPIGDSPAIAFTGTASYTLVGNTNPTDNAGNTGFLGLATLDANFSNQTVTSSIGLSINDTVWNASGTGQIANGFPFFGGAYTDIQTNGVDNASASGLFAGFFTDSQSADVAPLGAGLSYSLTDDGTVITGSAAFRDSSTLGVVAGPGGN